MEPTIEPRHVLYLPAPRAFLGHAVKPVLEAILGPVAVFYLVFLGAGFRWGVLGALIWTYAAAARRLWRRERVPGTLLLGIGLATLQAGLGYWSNSALLYFIQPTAGTFLVGMAFLFTAAAGRPLIGRLAADFCPFDPELAGSDLLARLFLKLSWFWAAVLTVHTAANVTLLLFSSVQAFVPASSTVSSVLLALGVVVSVVHFVRSLGRQGIKVSFAGPLRQAHLVEVNTSQAAAS